MGISSPNMMPQQQKGNPFLDALKDAGTLMQQMTAMKQQREMIDLENKKFEQEKKRDDAGNYWKSFGEFSKNLPGGAADFLDTPGGTEFIKHGLVTSGGLSSDAADLFINGLKTTPLDPETIMKKATARIMSSDPSTFGQDLSNDIVSGTFGKEVGFVIDTQPQQQEQQMQPQQEQSQQNVQQQDTQQQQKPEIKKAQSGIGFKGEGSVGIQPGKVDIQNQGKPAVGFANSPPPPIENLITPRDITNGEAPSSRLQKMKPTGSEYGAVQNGMFILNRDEILNTKATATSVVKTLLSNVGATDVSPANLHGSLKALYTANSDKLKENGIGNYETFTRNMHKITSLVIPESMVPGTTLNTVSMEKKGTAQAMAISEGANLQKVTNKILAGNFTNEDITAVSSSLTKINSLPSDKKLEKARYDKAVRDVALFFGNGDVSKGIQVAVDKYIHGTTPLQREQLKLEEGQLKESARQFDKQYELNLQLYNIKNVEANAQLLKETMLKEGAGLTGEDDVFNKIYKEAVTALNTREKVLYDGFPSNLKQKERQNILNNDPVLKRYRDLINKAEETISGKTSTTWSTSKKNAKDTKTDLKYIERMKIGADLLNEANTGSYLFQGTANAMVNTEEGKTNPQQQGTTAPQKQTSPTITEDPEEFQSKWLTKYGG